MCAARATIGSGPTLLFGDWLRFDAAYRPRYEAARWVLAAREWTDMNADAAAKTEVELWHGASRALRPRDGWSLSRPWRENELPAIAGGRTRARSTSRAYDLALVNQPAEHERSANESRNVQEAARAAAARREAIRRANARGPSANLEETVRMIRAAEAMHGAARR